MGQWTGNLMAGYREGGGIWKVKDFIWTPPLFSFPSLFRFKGFRWGKGWGARARLNENYVGDGKIRGGGDIRKDKGGCVDPPLFLSPSLRFEGSKGSEGNEEEEMKAGDKGIIMCMLFSIL